MSPTCFNPFYASLIPLFFLSLETCLLASLMKNIVWYWMANHNTSFQKHWWLCWWFRQIAPTTPQGYVTVLLGWAFPYTVLTCLFLLMCPWGKGPRWSTPFLFGAALVALGNKSGGVRLTAVGYTLRRLAAKVAAFSGVDEITELLSPRQLGYGIHGGAEAVVHAAKVPPEFAMTRDWDILAKTLLEFLFFKRFTFINSAFFQIL